MTAQLNDTVVLVLHAGMLARIVIARDGIRPLLLMLEQRAAN